MRYKGFEIRLAKQTGGKAGKNRNKTSTVQVWDWRKNNPDVFFLKKQIRFRVGDAQSLHAAYAKARAFIDKISHEV